MLRGALAEAPDGGRLPLPIPFPIPSMHRQAISRRKDPRRRDEVHSGAEKHKR